MQTKKENLISIKFISIIIMCLYVLFLLIDISNHHIGNKYSTYLKFSCILLCFIISLLIGSNGFNLRDVFLLKLARFFTLVADYFLLLSSNYILGVLFFCMVQIIYIERHSLMGTNKLNIKINHFILLPIFILLLIFSSLIFHFTDYKSLLTCSALVYSLLLSFSVYCGVRTMNCSNYNNRSALFISWGMILFLLCDINVALYQLINMNFLPSVWSNFQFTIGVLIWIFYLSSQLLLTLSGIRIKK